MVRNLWSLLDSSITLPIANESFADCLKNWHDNPNSDVFIPAVTLVWLIWFRRNKIIHENVMLLDVYRVKKCRDTAGFCMLNVGSGSGHLIGVRNQHQEQWKKLNVGWWKVNTDA